MLTKEEKIKKAIEEIDCDTLEYMDDDGELISDDIRDLDEVVDMVLGWYFLELKDITAEDMLKMAERYIAAREAIGW